MNKLNKIFYGPAGTGKTRSAIIEAVGIINESRKSDNTKTLDFKFDKNNYNEILTNFKSFSKLPTLDITKKELIQTIQDNNISPDAIAGNDDNDGQLKRLTNGTLNIELAVKEIKKYRENYKIYPLIETVTFHPSYSYQDFVEGIGVETIEITLKDKSTQNEIVYKVKDGIFKKICDRARNNSDYHYVLMIDEINRGDISSIFGELFTLLEDSKREGENEKLSINLPYSKDEKGNPRKLSVPKNLHIVATMNTVDKSIALIDVALRRRFDFEECMPDSSLVELQNYKGVDLPKLLDTMNERISILKNENYQIGHSEFLKIKDLKDLKTVMKKNIIPLLQEYFYDDWKSICAVLNQDYNKPTTGVLKVTKTDGNLFKKEFKEMITYSNQNIFMINEDFKEQDIRDIYSNN